MDNTTDALFHFLSEPGRRQLVRLLGEAPLTVGEIAEILALPQSTVSRHLKSLRSTGLLIDRREGTRTINRLREPNGNYELADILNHWLREQALSRPVKARLDLVLNRRNGDEDTFATLAHRWDDLRFRYFGSQFHLEALTSLLPSEWDVLDIGTGTGYLLPTLARQFQQVTAVDPSAAMLELARMRVRQEGLDNVRFRYGRLESLPVSTASKDLVLAILVLHHSSLQERALREIHRVLKPGGTLLIIDFYPHEMETFQQEMGDPGPGIDPEKLGSLASQLGFKNTGIRLLHSPEPGSPGGPEKPAPELFMIRASR